MSATRPVATLVHLEEVGCDIIIVTLWRTGYGAAPRGIWIPDGRIMMCTA